MHPPAIHFRYFCKTFYTSKMNRNQKTFVSVLTIGVLLIFGYVVLTKKENGVKQTNTVNKDVYVKTIQATPALNDVIFAGHGRVTSAKRINITPEVQGKLLAGDVPLKQGASFRKGSVLFRINNTEAALAMKAKKSSFLNRVANVLPDIQVDFEKEFDNWNTFFAQIEVDKPLPTLPTINNNQLKTFLATKNVLTDYYAILVDQERLSKYTIKAPFAGTFLSVNAEIGTSVSMGSPIATIINTSNLEVEVPLAKEEALLVNTGSKVILTTEDNVEIIGTVSRVSESVNANTQSLSVFVNASTSKLYDGMYLRAQIIAKSINNTIKAPIESVLDNNQVFCVVNNKLIKKQITIAYQGNDYVLLADIAKPVELVVEKNKNLSEGLSVKTISAL